MAMADSERAKMLSEELAGKDPISEVTQWDGRQVHYHYLREEVFLSDRRSGLTAMD